MCHGVDEAHFVVEPNTYALKVQFIRDYCEVCPVRADCFNNATKEDLDWTVRGGLMPIYQSPRTKGRPLVETTEDEKARRIWLEKRGGKCVNGHRLQIDDVYAATRKGRRTGGCWICRRATEAKANLKRREAAGELLRKPAEKCKNGHLFTDANTIWCANNGRAKYRRCRTCRTEYSNARESVKVGGTIAA